MKRTLIGVVLALTLLLSLCTVAAYAAQDESSVRPEIALWNSNVYVEGSSGIEGFGLFIYHHDKPALVKVQETSGIFTATVAEVSYQSSLGPQMRKGDMVTVSIKLNDGLKAGSYTGKIVVTFYDPTDGSTIETQKEYIYIQIQKKAGSTAPASQTQSTFTDVSASSWYAGYVGDVQKYGIINGVGNNRFDPEGTLTLAQAITMSARTYAYENGKTIPTGSAGDWYQPYLQFAADNGICGMGEFGSNYNGVCSRLIMAQLFYRVFPENTERQLNNVTSLPDVPNTTQNAGVFFLYQQGVLTGNDDIGTFEPYASITRAQTAAILNRVLDETKRQELSWAGHTDATSSSSGSLTITQQPQSSSSNSNNSVLTVSVTGSNGPCYYQWQQYKEQRNGTMEWSHLSYGTESTYTPKESGTYRVIVYDEAGNVVISDSAEIYGSYPLVIVEQPKDDLTTPFGSNLATGFIVRVAGGQPPYSYQWYYCEPGETTFHVYEGKTSDNITIVASWFSDLINKPGYRFKCVITDQAGASVTSDIVRLGKEDPLAAGDKT